MNWNFAKIWNESLTSTERREPAQRDYIYASELGGPYIDRYLKMKGTTPTNPPNSRSLRKFQAGNIWEFVLQFVLTRSGILIESQQQVNHSIDGLLPVHGRIDFIAGGKPDFDRAEREVSALGLPDILNHATKQVIESLKALPEVELNKYILEIKSSSDIMFSKYERVGANPHHRLQIFHYLKGMGIGEGHIVYVNKDNCMLLEFPVFSDDKDLMKAYTDDISAMTDIMKFDVMPAKEPLVVFDDFKFRTNWKVEYSNFLTMIYGFETPESYREAFKNVSGWTRVYNRCVKGDKMTAKNLEIIAEIKKTFPNFDELVDIGKEHKDLIATDDEE